METIALPQETLPASRSRFLVLGTHSSKGPARNNDLPTFTVFSHADRVEKEPGTQAFAVHRLFRVIDSRLNGSKNNEIVRRSSFLFRSSGETKNIKETSQHWQMVISPGL